MTRVEVSLCRLALQRYRPLDVGSKTVWHLAADRALKTLAGDVLNHEPICAGAYRELSLSTLLGLLGRCPGNALVVGQHYSWLINAATCHRQHYVGTVAVTG